jgi:outer membrane lipoprotein-sorting protein
LSGVGFATYETVELSELDLVSASLKRSATRAIGDQARAVAVAPGKPLAYTQSPAPAGRGDEIEKARALLGQVVDAKGGLATLRAVKSIVVTQTLINPATPSDTGFQTTTYIQYPDRFRTETPSAQGGVNVQVFDGAELWAKDAHGVRDLPDAVTREARNTLRRDPIALLLAASDGSLTPRVLPDVPGADGHSLRALELSAPDFTPVVLFVDAESLQLRKMTFVPDAPGRPTVEDEYSDYRAVSGVQIAFQASRRSGPQAIARRITEITINTPIDPVLFKRPS